VQQHSGCERAELQGTQVDPPPHLRIGGIEDLEAAIEQETGLPVGAHPAADAVVGLQHPDRRARRDQITRARQARHPGTDHDDPKPAPAHDATIPALIDPSHLPCMIIRLGPGPVPYNHAWGKNAVMPVSRRYHHRHEPAIGRA
jgi:hypothetical protein